MLETKRLYLRECVEEDLERFYEIYSDETVSRYNKNLSSDRDEELEIMRAYKRMYEFYGYGMWTVCLKQNDMVIGRAGLENYEMDGENALQLGYVIDKNFRKKGYAYEICSAICAYAQQYIYVDKILCIIHRENKASIKLAEKLRFILVNQTENMYMLKLEI